MPKEILDEAAGKIGEDHINYDKHLKDIARDKRYWEEKRRKIHENEKRLDDVVAKYSNELQEASRLRKEIIREAQLKAQEIIANANKTIETTIREIRESQAEKEKTRIVRAQLEAEKQKLLSEEEEEERLKRKIEKIKDRENRKKKKTEKETVSEYDKKETSLLLQKGDYVKLPNQAIGEILDIKAGKALIALGNIRTQIAVEQLRKASANQIKKQTRPANRSAYPDFRENMSQKRLMFKPEIDVRGLRGDEALQKVTEFIDEAVMLDSKNLRILHGTGTGALRQIIREYLSTNPVVGSYSDEQVQLGGAGITVVKLDI